MASLHPDEFVEMLLVDDEQFLFPQPTMLQ
jgi:hypothetical protein